jgi:D-alanyl-D-alanine carboxypeptidase/D-alanyl-D-alanine-endopeptidase (penicillin-binding protein 4)
VFRLRLLLGLVLAAALVVPVAPAAAITPTKLRSALNAEMRKVPATSGVYVMALDGDERLYSKGADRSLIPASVNKLFVTSTALMRFGPDTRLDTTVVTDGKIDKDGVLRGNLYLVGGGDPTLSTTRIKELAGQLAVTSVRGRVYGDESRFDSLRGSAATGGRLDSEIGGQLGALVADRGYVRGGWQKRPAAVAADALRAALEQRDVPVRGRTRLGTAPEGAVELATSSSAPMSELIARTNIPSDNYYAETLLKNLGASFGDSGSTDAGARVVRDEMEQLEIAPTVVDGSGLSRSDRTQPRQVVQLLATMAGGEQADTFVDSLSTVGRTGTLANRMKRTPAAGRCHGKTGTLSNVSNVAGICETRAGAVAFAILMNNVSVWSAHAVQDRMVATIARLTS